MRFFSLILVICMLFCSCKAEKKEIFDYQDGEIELDCTLTYNGHENGVKIYMSAPNENGERENIKLEYTEPSIIGGYTLEKADGKYFGKMGGVEIPFGDKTAGAVKLLEQLFSLDEDMVSGISSAENGMTNVDFISDGISGKIITDENGVPVSLDATFSNGYSLSLKIKK